MALRGVFSALLCISACLACIFLVTGEFRMFFKDHLDLSKSQPGARWMSLRTKELEEKGSELDPCKEYDTALPGGGNRGLTPMRDMVFLHMGKAGGGTVRDRAESGWGLSFREEHPKPNKSRKKGLIWIGLRDPVDRFVSAFYWRKLVICDPDNETRKVGKAAFAHPTEICKRSTEREEEIIFSRYNRDAGNLAEALCSSNASEASLAAEDIKYIGHVQFDISDWLGDDLGQYSETLFPIILESPFDLNLQIDDAVRWVHSITHFEDEDVFAKRQEGLIAMDKCRASQSDAPIPLGGGVKHSSKGVTKSLSANAEACLVKFFSPEYDLLRQIGECFCRTDTCRGAIQNILARRQM